MGDAKTTTDAVSFLLQQHNEVKRLFGEMGTATGESKKDLFQCLVRLLAVHETAEEEVIYPTIRASVEKGSDLVSPRLEEEDKAKKALSELEKVGVDAPEFDQKFSTLKGEVLEHAEHEEQEIFPALRNNVSAEQLQKLGTALEAAEKMAPTHPHPHAPESAVGNLIVGPFAMIADKARDALRSRKSA
jgi:hemerythrin superfamily protein